MPARALADPPACPPGPAAYGGTDPVVAETRDLRSDLAVACAAVVDRLETGNTTAATAEGRLLDLVNSTANVDANLSDVLDRVGLVMAGTDGAAIHAQLDNPPDASAAVAATEGVGSGLHSDMWFLCGVVASLLGSFGLYRLVMPRG